MQGTKGHLDDGHEEDGDAVDGNARTQATAATVDGVAITGAAPISIPAPQGSTKVCFRFTVHIIFVLFCRALVVDCY